MPSPSTSKLLWIFIVMSLLFLQRAYAETPTLQVKGAVKHSCSISLSDLKTMPPFHVNGIVRIEEKATSMSPERYAGTDRYRGVLLRDILGRAGMIYVRKWEPGVYIRVKGESGREAVFSFGEIFYSSSGRGIFLAYEKNNHFIETGDGVGELVIATDVRAGRFISGVKEISVERVNLPLSAYDDKKKQVVRPFTKSFVMIDQRSGEDREFKAEDLHVLPVVQIRHALMAGDCEGFNGVHGSEGPLLRSVLEWFDLDWENRDYSRFVVVSSEDGFCAVFSIGELFNSRLDNNIIIAGKKNGKVLEPSTGFAASVVVEDSMGGRSVKRISRVEIY